MTAYQWDETTKPEWAGAVSSLCDMGDHARCTGTARVTHNGRRVADWCGCGCGCTARPDPKTELKEWLVVAGSVGLLLGTFGPW